MLKFKHYGLPRLSEIFSANAFKRLKKCKDAAKLIQEIYHIHWLYFFFDIIICRCLYGAELNDDYMHYRMYSMKWYERKKYVTYGKFVKTTKLFFTDYANEYTDSKIGFLEHYKKYHKRDYIILPHSMDEEVRTFLENHKEVFFKDEYSNCAKGVHKYKSSDIVGNDELLKSILSTVGVLEECVKQCKEMEALNPSCCNSLRITTMVEKDGNVRIFSAALRIGGKDSCIDNIHAGGCAYPVDVETGIVLSAGWDLNGRVCIYSPTGIVVPGFQIPFWDKVKDAMVSAAKVCPEARFVGWDVAIGEDGPVFIEANNSSGPTVFQFDGGKWDYFLAQK